MVEATVNRIAYISAEGDLFTIGPDGGSPRNLTGGEQAENGGAGARTARVVNFDTAYAWPTWSPDGSKLAVSRVDVSGNELSVSVQVIDAATGRMTAVFNNEAPGLIADRTPHYLYWSPDSIHLSVLATAPRGLSLFVIDTSSPGNPSLVETGAPLYFHWSDDAATLLLHVGGEMKLAAEPFATARGLLDVGGTFRVAAFSPDGQKIAYATDTEDGRYLNVASIDDLGNPQRVLEIDGLSAFAWSPDARELAVADQQGLRSAVLRRLRVIAPDGSSVRTITEESLVAFYWSPDGAKLAWVGLNSEERVFVLKAGQASGEGIRELFQFQPSADVLTMLTFFDQYLYSHSPWSPDSSSLVIAGTLKPPSSATNGHAPSGDRVYVIDAAGEKEPLEIASGSLAFWSWN